MTATKNPWDIPSCTISFSAPKLSEISFPKNYIGGNFINSLWFVHSNGP